jgi:hypothetical protein
MRDNRFTITIPRETWAAILDAIQHAIVDKYAAKATRKAALSALLALIDAGAVAEDTSINSPARDARGAGSGTYQDTSWADFFDALPARRQHPIDRLPADAEHIAMAVALRPWAFSATKEARFARGSIFAAVRWRFGMPLLCCAALKPTGLT